MADSAGVAMDRFAHGRFEQVCADARAMAARGLDQRSAILLARTYGERKRNFVGQHFWARGFFVSTVGRDEEVIREYIRRQEEEDKRLDQMGLW